MSTENKDIVISEKETLSQGGVESIVESVKYAPKVDIVENAESIILRADLPGVSQENLSVNVEDNGLSITGLVREVRGTVKPVHLEYGLGGYTRSFRLGNAIDPAKITASLKHGVLTLTLQKSDRLKPRRIEVSAA